MSKDLVSKIYKIVNPTLGGLGLTYLASKEMYDLTSTTGSGVTNYVLTGTVMLVGLTTTYGNVMSIYLRNQQKEKDQDH